MALVLTSVTPMRTMESLHVLQLNARRARNKGYMDDGIYIIYSFRKKHGCSIFGYYFYYFCLCICHFSLDVKFVVWTARAKWSFHNRHRSLELSFVNISTENDCIPEYYRFTLVETSTKFFFFSVFYMYFICNYVLDLTLYLVNF